MFLCSLLFSLSQDSLPLSYLVLFPSGFLPSTRLSFVHDVSCHPFFFCFSTHSPLSGPDTSFLFPFLFLLFTNVRIHILATCSFLVFGTFFLVDPLIPKGTGNPEGKQETMIVYRYEDFPLASHTDSDITHFVRRFLSRRKIITNLKI